MSEYEAATARLDESKLGGDDGEIYLFNWLSSTEKLLEQSNPDSLKAAQSDLEATLVKVIIAQDPFPSPGRPLRNLVARCLITLFSNGESRTLFDTLQTFLRVAGDAKLLDKDMNKTAAVYCIGALMGVFGSQVMSLMTEITTVSLKIFKSANSVLLRYHALVALRKSLSTARRAITDAVVKDVFKQMRHALGDKSLPIQRSASDVLLVMYQSSEGVVTAADAESIVALCTKSLETADQLTCHSLSKLVGHLLASTQKEQPIPASDTKRGSNLGGPNDEDSTSAPRSLPEVKSILSFKDMLLVLSNHFNKVNSSKKLRVGIFHFYTSLLNCLGPSFVESNYAIIVNHLTGDVIAHQRNTVTRYEVLLARTLVGIILRDLIGVRMLGEQAQINAIQELSNSYLKRWPAIMPGQTAPNSLVLDVVLAEVAGLLQQLGNAPPPVQDALAEPLVTLLSHPNHTVRVKTAWALRCFCHSTPSQLPRNLLNVIDLLQRDINSLTLPTAPSDIATRALGHAYGLAALVSTIRDRPLYVSYDISAKVLDMSIQLLKRAGDHDIKVARVEVEVAWMAISSLMTLGPNFVRAHLPQLLVLWRNALPKPTSKDTTNDSSRGYEEWGFLMHVRESALGAILCFLEHNSPSLVTLDVARRVASLLSNALLFATSFLTQSVHEPDDESQRSDLPLRLREALLRLRAYQCFSALGHSGLTESIQGTLLLSTLTLFASPDGYAGSSVQAAIASSSGNFTSIWQTTDGYAYGVADLDIALSPSNGPQEGMGGGVQDKHNRDSIEVLLDDLLRKPVLGSCEHDPLSACRHQNFATQERIEPPPAATAVVNAAISLFAEILPLQDVPSIVRVLNQVVEYIRSPRLERNAGRKAAVTVNTMAVILLVMRQASVPHHRRSRESLADPQVTSVLSPFIKEGLIEGDPILRSIGSEAIGYLTSYGGTSLLASHIKLLVDHVVTNRDPHGRAGCAMAFGAIHAQVGGLVAGPLLKTTVNVLMSLVNDPHPVVHFWAMSALAKVVNSASLAYAPFVSSTLGMLFKVYMRESHEAEGGTWTNANLSGDLPAYQVVCLVIDALISVLGPDIQDSRRTRDLILSLVHEFFQETDEGICVEAIKCIQHFLIFAPEQIGISQLVEQLQGHLSSSRRPLKLASVNALYQLVQRDALQMSRIGGDRLVEKLFGMLDDDPSIIGVRDVISSWLQQTVILNPSAWIDLCQRIMSRTTATQQVVDAAGKTGGLRDDEGESLSLDVNPDGLSEGTPHSTSRWRTQLFALQCLHTICSVVFQSGRQEHVDIPFARREGYQLSTLLVSRVADLIKMAFTASAAYVTEIRLEGLLVLRDVIKIFSSSPDPDYADALLLEQYQAPITAALTPAFSSDSTPDILASAIETCAIFVGCGVVTDVNRMGRILKLLITTLDQSQEGGTMSLGDTVPISPNASVMLRIATLSAWAELEVASAQRAYLKVVLDPHRQILVSLWMSALRDYASVKAECEVAQEVSSTALESSYSSLGREVLLPYYADAWPVILHALAAAMEAREPFLAAAMDGQPAQGSSAGNGNPQHSRSEPSAMFFVLFGLVYEALVSSPVDPVSDSSSHSVATIALFALKGLVRPEYSGKALLQSPVFEEWIGLCYRLAMTEPTAVQVCLLDTLTSFASSYPVNPDGPLSTTPSPGWNFPLSIPQSHCLRICGYILRHSLPRTPDSLTHSNSRPSERIRLIQVAFESFLNIGLTLGPTHQEEVRAAALSIYSELLRDESAEIDYVGPTLPSLKLFLDPPRRLGDPLLKYERSVHGLLSACLVNIDNMRGRQGTIASKIVKSSLLVSVLVLTCVPPSVKLGRGVLERCCLLISRSLMEDGEISFTAAHCCKTLVGASASGNATLQQCARLLLPSMIEFLAEAARVGNDLAPETLVTTGEILKAFLAVFGSLGEPLRVRALATFLPVLILPLDPSRVPPSGFHTQSVTHLLSLATLSPSIFKEATVKLNPSSRDKLESSIRQSLTTKPPGGDHQSGKPQISLRSF
ncbi:hypothetical protein JAAARDRAFT_80176 [Jaapia argillacea MUCL 33604]|uniref:LAA1-like C-terminal TPR repeats domain-containing protein n=1 Tax=Jaapia argillacea MUCL 33604 TaxID=933084 RepID=A0A067PVX1_9AGAM|nr:hypothetical protein JAAARDRAFT_80176 [Jaapia argillacea MUCL 33604]